MNLRVIINLYSTNFCDPPRKFGLPPSQLIDELLRALTDITPLIRSLLVLGLSLPKATEMTWVRIVKGSS